VKKLIIIPAPGTAARVITRTAAGTMSSIRDARAIRGETFEVIGDFVVEEVDTTRYVTVTVRSRRISEAQRSMEWTYIDPTGDLEVGDVVKVPFGYSNALVLATVSQVDVGRGNLAKSQIKTVAQVADFEPVA